MKLKEAMSAYLAAETLSREKLPYATAAAIVRVKRETREFAELYLQEEKKLVEAYAEIGEDGMIRIDANGRFRCREGLRAADYEESRKDLGETEVAVEARKMRVSAPERITPEQIEALSPWMEFEVEA